MEWLGCSPEYFVIHLERMFGPTMTMENHGEVWTVDHIKPISAFDLDKPEEKAACFHFSNMQPLLTRENIEKGDKWDPANEWQVTERRTRAEAAYAAFLAGQAARAPDTPQA